MFCYSICSVRLLLYPIIRFLTTVEIAAGVRIIEPVMERAVFRIIDANFNRGREAVRVVEEFCRFALNSRSLSARAKELRHKLCAAIDKLDAGRLIAGRDTRGDVGVGQRINDQLVRGHLRDCFTAACKRLTEALRVLAEMTQTINIEVSEALENLRYSAYTLEKDITIFSSTAEKFRFVRLYVIITSSLPADVVSLTCRCAAGGADCIQLRAKSLEDAQLFALAVEFVRICAASGVLSIINDRADIAISAGADGVHLGQNDLGVEQARGLALSPLIVGKSTHSIEQLQAACRENPTYAALGPVFATPTKPGAEAVGLEYVTTGTEMLAETGIGHVAIGGVTLDNIQEVLRAGARSVAVCSAITESADPTSACRAFKERLNVCEG